MLIIFKTLVAVQWLLFVITILIFTILLRIIRTASKERLVRILSIGVREATSIADIKEKLSRAVVTLKIVKVNIIMSSAIVIISLLGIWYLIKMKHVHVPLPEDFIAMSILGIIPLTPAILLFEYFVKKTLAVLVNMTIEKEIKP